jgi:hypothetical protein
MYKSPGLHEVSELGYSASSIHGGDIYYSGHVLSEARFANNYPSDYRLLVLRYLGIGTSE